MGGKEILMNFIVRIHKFKCSGMEKGWNPFHPITTYLLIPPYPNIGRNGKKQAAHFNLFSQNYFFIYLSITSILFYCNPTVPHQSFLSLARSFLIYCSSCACYHWGKCASLLFFLLLWHLLFLLLFLLWEMLEGRIFATAFAMHTPAYVSGSEE